MRATQAGVLALLLIVAASSARSQSFAYPQWRHWERTSSHSNEWLRFANAACDPARPKLRRIKVVWSGKCVDGWLEGRGVLWVSIDNRTMTFTGAFVHGHAEGDGRMDFDGYTNDLTSLVGRFHDGLPNGRGVMTDRAGMKTDGNFLYDDLTDGDVSIQYIDGSKLSFSIKSDQQSGTSSLRYADGTIIKWPALESPKRMALYSVDYADGGRLVSEVRTDYTNDGAVYCAPDGQRYAGKFIPAAWDTGAPHNAANYPPLSRRMKEEGTVEVAFVVDRDGSKRDLEIHKGVYPRLDDAAMAAVASWTYQPATVAGHALPSYVIVDVAFELNPRMIESDVPINVPPTRRFLGGMDRCPRRR